ncbi:MAG TPA: hypothetical protein VKI44_32260 [Acetobacteraceae bacterium]|nr:hypothetical protein [Acetobacteraceae bacterium]
MPITDPKAEVRAYFQHALAKGIDDLGEVEARRLWAEVAKRPRGGRRGPRDRRRDAALLHEYVRRAGRCRNNTRELSALPRQIAEYAHSKWPGIFGNAVGAIEKHIRRLLRSRNWLAWLDKHPDQI